MKNTEDIIKYLNKGDVKKVLAAKKIILDFAKEMGGDIPKLETYLEEVREDSKKADKTNQEEILKKTIEQKQARLDDMAIEADKIEDPRERSKKMREIGEEYLEFSEALDGTPLITQNTLEDSKASKIVEGFLKRPFDPAISTGFEKFDEALGGGLRAGRLYGLGAITSLGKTTFATQIGDNIAARGGDVLIFSLEMDKYELLGKSISRKTYEMDKNNAFTLQEILNFDRLGQLLEEEKKLIKNVLNKYKSTAAKHISIIEGAGNVDVRKVRVMVEKFYEFENRKPVVIIDYLQILAPYNERFSDKQNIDKNVLELKRIARDFQVPIIIVNSFNRANYLSEVSFESFKESGAIEYSCDVLIALQLKIPDRENWTENHPTINEKRKAINEAKVASPREIEAIILKNRAFKAYAKVDFEYIAKYDFFEESKTTNQWT
jgi:replicative DNA helicase